MEDFLPVLLSAKERGLKLTLHLSEVTIISVVPDNLKAGHLIVIYHTSSIVDN